MDTSVSFSSSGSAVGRTWKTLGAVATATCSSPLRSIHTPGAPSSAGAAASSVMPVERLAVHLERGQLAVHAAGTGP